MKEAQSNIGGIHAGCAGNRKKLWQQENKDTLIEAGGFVQLGFEEEGETEWMWVKIEKVEGKEFHGILWNDPVIITAVNGADVWFTRNEIANYVKDD